MKRIDSGCTGPLSLFYLDQEEYIMEIGFLSVLSLGFILGVKHAMEPDHVIAVSTIASQSKRLSVSSLTGVFWGIGHTSTLLIIGMLLILMKGGIPDSISMSLEFLVGIMLVYFGISSFRSAKRNQQSVQHSHHHTSYKKSVFMGFIHGLAGSAAMVLLTMSTVNSVWEGILYILIFGGGTIVGMLLFTTILGVPFIISSKKVRLHTGLIKAAGGISILFGIYYMYNLGVSEGLFSMWFSASLK